MKQLPDIPGDVQEVDFRLDDMDTEVPQQSSYNTRKPNKGYSLLSLISVSVLSVVLSAVISIACVIAGRDTLLQWYGIAPAIPQSQINAQAINGLTANASRVDAELQAFREGHDALLTTLATMRSGAEALSARVDQSVSQIDALKDNVATQLGKIREDAEAEKKARAAQSVRPAARPAVSTPAVPVTLISVRNSAGTPLAALREGLSTSHLLMPGETWNGWTLIDANPAKRSATFSVSGAIKELYL